MLISPGSLSSTRARWRNAGPDIKSVTLCVAVALYALLSMAAQRVHAAVDSEAWQSLAEEADTVALVTVNRVHPLINQAMTLPGMRAVVAYAYQLSVNQLWKGSPPSEMQVAVRDCTTRLNSGERYLVFGQWGGNGEWQVNDCQHMLPELSAAEPIALLNQLFGHQVAQH